MATLLLVTHIIHTEGTALGVRECNICVSVFDSCVYFEDSSLRCIEILKSLGICVTEAALQTTPALLNSPLLYCVCVCLCERGGGVCACSNA